MMNDSEFIQRLYKCTNAIDLLTLRISGLTLNQFKIWYPLYCTARIGDDGLIFNGAERIEKEFPANFTDKMKFGVKTRGNFSDKDKVLALHKKYIEIAKQIVEGKKTGKKLQTKVCKKYGIQTSQYREFRDAFYKPWINGETRSEPDQSIDADMHLAIHISAIYEYVEAHHNQTGRDK